MSAEIERIEQLLEDAERLADPRARALAKALAAALVDLVAAGLTRVVEMGGPTLERQMADDDLVGNLLVLAGTHPDAPAVRAKAALEAASHVLGTLGVTLTSFGAEADGIVVKLTAERGARPDEDKVRGMVEAIVMSRAPDVESVRVEVGGVMVRQANFVSIDRLRVIG